MQQSAKTEQDEADQGNSEQLKAIAQAFEQHGETLLRDARIFVHKIRLNGDSEALAQDVLQDTALTAVRIAGRYDATRPALPWLRSILFNVVRTKRREGFTERKHVISVPDATRSAARKRQEQGTDISNFSEGDLLDLIATSSDESGASGGLELDDWLTRLAAPDQTILRLFYQDRLSVHQLATQLGISTGAAYTRLSRARDRFRDKFLDSGAES